MLIQYCMRKNPISNTLDYPVKPDNDRLEIIDRESLVLCHWMRFIVYIHQMGYIQMGILLSR